MNDEQYQRLGTAVAAALDEEVAGTPRIAQRAAVIEAMQSGARGGGRRSAIAIAVAVAAVLVAALALGWMLRSLVSPAAPALEVGQWLHATDDAAVEVPVGAGTKLRLEPGASARVVAFSAEAVEIVIEQGEVLAEVDPDAGAKWTLVAGPYAVEVVGTVFAVRWSAAVRRLDVEVQRGRVRVRGGELGDEGVLLAVGNSLSAGEQDPVTATRDRAHAEDVEAIDPAVDAPTEPEPEPEPEPAPTRDVDKRAPSKSHASKSWRRLARDGRFAEALEAADAEGFDDLAASLRAADLKLLADTARLGGDAARARRVLEAVRDRYPGTDEAARAAFDLGRMAKRDPGVAARWFSVYLAERPKGAYAREASGRLVEALHKAGKTSAARAAAERYLAAHPDGPHAALARSLVGG